MRFSACRWKTDYCEIFCGLQEGGEGKDKIPHHISLQNRVFSASHAQILFSIQKRPLCLVHCLDRSEKDTALAEIIAQQQECSFRTYGYRRMRLWLKSQNIFRDPKTVLRVMKKYGLFPDIRRCRKWKQNRVHLSIQACCCFPRTMR